jgi:hypothetical protein
LSLLLHLVPVLLTQCEDGVESNRSYVRQT